MSSTKSDRFTSSFLIWIPFVSFSCLLWSGLPILYWIKVAGVAFLVFLLILEETIAIFTIEYGVSCGLSYMTFIFVEVCSLCAHFLERFFFFFFFFNHKWMLNFVKSFLYSYSSIFYCGVSHWLIVDIEKCLHSWANPTWSRCMILLNVLLESVC